MLKNAVYTLAMGIALICFTAPAMAVPVDYTLTFTGTDGTKGNGTGELVINEPLPLSSFSENALGDIVSLVATVGGLTFNFVPANFEADLGTNQTFYSLSGSSSPGVTGPGGLTETLVLGGFGFNITNPGGPNLEDGSFTISVGTISATPLPSTWTMLIAGMIGLGFFIYRGSRRGSAVFASA